MTAVFSLAKRLVPAVSSFDLSEYNNSSAEILVISPHPDDDVIGMGGSMKLLSDRGAHVFSLYVTDGSLRKNNSYDNKRIAAVRQKEAVEALGIVRAKAGIFLGHKSERLIPDRIIEDIKETLIFFMPEKVYIPSVFERHATHLKVTELAVRAIRQIRDFFPELWGYSVWGGCPVSCGGRVVDITKVINIKKKSIKSHKSQLKDKDYASGIIGRNRYEGVFLETHMKKNFEYAETFVNMSELTVNRRRSLKTFAERLIVRHL